MPKKPKQVKKKSPGAEEQQLTADREEKESKARYDVLLAGAKKARFLEKFRHFPVISLAARRIGINRVTVYKWRKDDPEFDAALENLQEEYTDLLERELQKLATGQYKRPLVSAGKLVAFEDIHDVTALRMLLQAYRPRLYRERTEVSASVHQSIEIQKKEVTVHLVADVTKLLVEAGLGSNDPASLADTARDQGEPVDTALAVAKASRLPKSAA